MRDKAFEVMRRGNLRAINGLTIVKIQKGSPRECRKRSRDTFGKGRAEKVRPDRRWKGGETDTNLEKRTGKRQMFKRKEGRWTRGTHQGWLPNAGEMRKLRRNVESRGERRPF